MKKLITLVSGKGKSLKDLAKEAWDKYKDKEQSPKKILPKKLGEPRSAEDEARLKRAAEMVIERVNEFSTEMDELQLKQEQSKKETN